MERRLLHRPLDEVLVSGRPDFPFCLCWANENWTRAWDGLENNVLIAQRYSAEDDRRHLQWLAVALSDSRYIRVDGKPLLLIYRISQLPSPAVTAANWREEARRLGIGELFLAFVESLREDRQDPTRLGFDASVEFQPDWMNLDDPAFIVSPENQVYSYESLVNRALSKPAPDYRQFPCVAPGWDNSPRRVAGARIFTGSTPELYERWLAGAVARAQERGGGLVFVNAWNEWAEGAHLEPSAQWGRQFLEATRRGAVQVSALQQPPAYASVHKRQRRAKVSVCIPTWNGAKFLAEAIDSVLRQTFDDFELVIVDDASTDGSASIARARADARIEVVTNQSRLGLVGNWNRCLEQATGDYVCLFHQDDVMMPSNLERKVAMLDANPNVGFVHSNVWQVGPSGEIISNWWYSEPRPEDEGVHSGHQVFERLLRGVNLIACPSVVVRRECFTTVGTFDSSLPFTTDWEMWMRIALLYDVGYLIEPLVHYRRHADNETLRFGGVKELEDGLLAKRRLLSRAEGRIHDGVEIMREVTVDYRRQALERARERASRGERAQALDFLAFAIRLQETLPRVEHTSWLLDVLEDWMTIEAAGRLRVDEELRAANHEIQALRNSFSWRMTSPVRAAYDVWLRVARAHDRQTD